MRQSSMKSRYGILWKGVLELCTDLKMSKESNVLIQFWITTIGSFLQLQIKGCLRLSKLVDYKLVDFRNES